MLKIHLLIIDPQNDFCDSNTGALYVPGAEEDMTRIGEFIKQKGDKLYDIHVTLDTHHYLDIAHPSFWVGSDGKEQPTPLATVITVDDVKNGKWRAKNPAWQKRALEYVEQLEANKRYALVVWPPHCLIGNPGHNIHPNLLGPLLEWEKKYGWVDYVTKGSNIFTEHYSAVKADVPDPEDTTTDLNTELIEVLESGDMIVVAGEASDFCVANTMRDIVNEFGEDSTKKIVLAKNGMSAVNAPGLEHLAEDFFNEMRSKQVKIENLEDIL